MGVLRRPEPVRDGQSESISHSIERVLTVRYQCGRYSVDHLGGALVAAFDRLISIVRLSVLVKTVRVPAVCRITLCRL